MDNQISAYTTTALIFYRIIVNSRGYSTKKEMINACGVIISFFFRLVTLQLLGHSSSGRRRFGRE
jgi:hypothetical protein